MTSENTVVPLVNEPWAKTLPGVDLASLMRQGVKEPVRLCDGHLYAGSLHSLMAEPEAGKTTIAAWWAARILAGMNTVVWIDEESGRDSLADKMLSLGVDPEDVSNGLHYVEFPGLSWTDEHLLALRCLLDALQPALIVFDSAAGFLSAAGLAENDNDATGTFYKRVLLRAARHGGAAVVVIDHVAKSAEGGNRYARGAGAKLAYVDVSYSLERIRPFTRSESGALRLVVRKDRSGWLHRQHDLAVHVHDGRIVIQSDESAPSIADGFGPAARKLMDALTSSDTPMTNNELVDQIAAKYGHGLTRETVSREMNALLKAGLVDVLEDGFRGAKRWLLACPQEGVTSRDEP